MDIGTAKPSRGVRARVPHHLIDICDPAEAYSAGRFRRDALRLIAAIRARGRRAAAGRRHDAVFPRADCTASRRCPRPTRRCARAIDATRAAARLAGAARRARGARSRRRPRASARRTASASSAPSRCWSSRASASRTLQQLAEPAPLALRGVRAACRTTARRCMRGIDARFVRDDGRRVPRRGPRAARPRRPAPGPAEPALASATGSSGRTSPAPCSLDEAVAAGQRATRNLAKRQLTWLRSEPAWQRIQGLEDQELAPIMRVMDTVAGR